MNRSFYLGLFIVALGAFPAVAQTAPPTATPSCVGEILPNGQLGPCNGGGNTVPPSSGNSGSRSSAANTLIYNGAYDVGSQVGEALGQALGQLLFGSHSDPAAEARQQLLRRQMMEELRLREQEASREHQAEEARRLAAIYDRLSSTLKLSGMPHLQLKTSDTTNSGLQLKLGDGAPSSTTFAEHLSDLHSTPYLQLKLGAQAQANAIPGLPGINTTGSGTIDVNNMTPKQAADMVEFVSKLPPEQQQQLLNAAQAKSKQQPNQHPVMRDFQQTLDGKSDLHRLGPSAAGPDAGSQNSSATPETGNQPAPEPSPQR